MVALRDQPRLGVAAGIKHPAIEPMAGGKIDEPGGRTLVVGAWPGHAVGNVARVFGDGVVVGDEPYRDAATAEAAGDRQAAMGAAEDQGAACARDRHAGSRKSA